MRQPDSRLVTEALAGRAESVEALVLRYQRKAYAIALAIGLKTVEPDDVVQESFLRAIRSLSSLRAPESFGAWFLEIVRNTARHHARPPRVRLSSSLDEAPGAAGESLESRELKQAVWREVGRLPEAIRETIFLYYYEGESVRAVAVTTGVSAGAVKMRLKRGRELLRRALWRELRDELRESRPSGAEWTRRGRAVSLVVLSAPGSLTLGGTVAAKAAGTGLTANAGPSILSAPGTTLLVKATMASAIAALLILVVSFTMKGVKRGPVDRIVSPASSSLPSATPETPEAGGAELDSTSTAAVGPGGAVESSPVEVTGVVVDGRGGAVAGAIVIAGAGSLVSPSSARTITTATGRFRLDLPAGDTQLAAFKGGVGVGLALVPGGTSEIEVPLLPLCEISGRVHDHGPRAPPRSRGRRRRRTGRSASMI